MLGRSLKNEALHFYLKRYLHVGRSWRHKLMKQNTNKLLTLTKEQDRQGSMLLIDRIQQSIPKANSQLYIPFLNNKMIIEYYFRQFGRVEMTLLNSIEYCNFLKLSEQYKAQQYVKLTLLHLIYQYEKLPNIKEQMQLNLGKLDRVGRWEAQFLLSLANMHQKSGAIDKMFESLTTLLNESQFNAIEFKYRTMVAILTLKVIGERDPQKDYGNTLPTFKKLIKNQEITVDAILTLNSQKMLDYLLSHDADSQVTIHDIPRQKINPELINLIHVMAQRKIMQKDFQGAQELIRKLPFGSLKTAFLENSINLQRKRYRQSQFAIRNLLDFKSPPVISTITQQQDPIKYQLHKMLQFCYGKLSDKYNQEKMECDSETFCLVNQYDKEARKAYFFNLPFKKYFGLEKINL